MPTQRSFPTRLGSFWIIALAFAPFACSGGDDASSPSSGDGGSSSSDAASDAESSTPNDGSATKGDSAIDAGGVTTVFTIVLEDHDYAEVVGNTSAAPYLNSLIDAYGLATSYSDSGSHPSLPNYLVMVSGAPQYAGFIDVDPTQAPYFPTDQPNLGTQLITASVPWRAYGEGMGTACNVAHNGLYTPVHDPFLYFIDIQHGDCASTNVDYASFAADLVGGTYRYMYIAPNVFDDGKSAADGGTTTDFVATLSASDAWCQTEIGKIMNSNAYKTGGVIFITWDEAEGRNADSPDQVPMIVVSPFITSPGFKSATPYSHKSYLATVEDLLHLPRLATISAEPSMREFFR